jgi:4-diphosphocytidyl-2-C-methyl-D-erythritol kinase
MLTVYAPAKINLVLEVLSKYDDYYQISSILQTINLYDVLRFQPAEQISFKCSEPSLEHNNLVTEAAVLLQKTAKCAKGVWIELRKNIPWGVGLGGGSSDAAATLLSLNKLWRLGLSNSELGRLGFKLGSDVPFFIYGGIALVEGKGETVTPVPSLCPIWFVLLVPPLPKIQDKTRQLYGKLNADYFTEGEFVHAVLAYLGQEGKIAPSAMFNVFEKVVFDSFQELSKYKRIFEEAGAPSIHLSGSGPCLFTIAYEKKKADKLFLGLKRQGLECYVVSSLPGNS